MTLLTYCDLLKIEDKVSSMASTVGPSFVFQQHNVPKHTSRLCKSYLSEKERDASDDLASTITHLNPTGLIWDKLDWRVKEKQPTST